MHGKQIQIPIVYANTLTVRERLSEERTRNLREAMDITRMAIRNACSGQRSHEYISQQIAKWSREIMSQRYREAAVALLGPP